MGTKRAAYTAMSDDRARRTLWMPYWHILMHALRPGGGGSRTRDTIRAIAQHDSGA
jgi:hypothetical protein